jgi:hypothetical protein
MIIMEGKLLTHTCTLVICTLVQQNRRRHSLRMLKLNFPLAVLSLVAILFSAPARSFADTYQLSPLTSDNGYFFYGMDDTGHVVINNPFTDYCGFSGSGCFYTFLNGVSTGIFATAPTFAWDYSAIMCNSAPCVVSDNGWTATISLESNGLTDDLFVSSGSNPAQLLLRTRGFTDIFAINGVGDIVFDNGLQDQWFEEVNLDTLPTPEPSSLLLLATGILALTLTGRRRLTQN